MKLGFQMKFAGDDNPVLSPIKLNGENVCSGGGTSPSPSRAPSPHLPSPGNTLSLILEIAIEFIFRWHAPFHFA